MLLSWFSLDQVSNSGPRAKIGPLCNYIWPAKPNQMTNRAGPPGLGVRIRLEGLVVEMHHFVSC